MKVLIDLGICEKDLSSVPKYGPGQKARPIYGNFAWEQNNNWYSILKQIGLRVLQRD